MQAIRITYLPPTNNLPARLIAACKRGKLKMSKGRLEAYNHHSKDTPEQKLIQKLCEKFQFEDIDQFGPTSVIEPNYYWIASKFIQGELPDNSVVFVRKL